METDPHLVPVLRGVVEPAGVTVVEGDARHLDWTQLLGDERWTLVANLPYNVATPLVLDLLEQVPAIERMLVMVQREVGERLAGHVGDDAYGAVSVKVAFWATATVVGSVPATVFVPRPNVESALVASIDDRLRRWTRASTGAGCSRWSTRASVSGARCSAGRWRGPSA